MGFGYMTAVDEFLNDMVNYGTGGPHSIRSFEMPHWVCPLIQRLIPLFYKFLRRSNTNCELSTL